MNHPRKSMAALRFGSGRRQSARGMPLRIKVIVVVVVAIVMAAMVIGHVHGVNGPWYWFWAWRRLPVAIYLLMPLASLPVFVAMMLDLSRRRMRVVAIGLLMAGSFLMRLASIYLITDPPSLDMIPVAVEDRFVTSYYTDAKALSHFPLRDWLTLYPQYMQEMSLHSKTKAPGPVLYWIGLIHLWGIDHITAMRGGLLLGILATLSIPASYIMIRQLLGSSEKDDVRSAFYGAAFLSVCPGFVLSFPMFDPVYPILSALLIATWAAAIRKDRARYALMLGGVLAAVCIISFNVLIVGLFMVGLAIVELRNRTGSNPLLLLKHATIAFVCAGTVLLIVTGATGYNPIDTLIAAVQNQRALEAQYAGDRKWPTTIVFDLTDFALGAGWIGPLLGVYCLLERLRPRGLTRLAMGQIAAVALLGLMPAETARVWNFLLPLLAFPIGIELQNWPQRARITAFAVMVLVATAIAQNMRIVN